LVSNLEVLKSPTTTDDDHGVRRPEPVHVPDDLGPLGGPEAGPA